MSEIILINDLIDLRHRKQKELEFYNEQLEQLKERMLYIRREIDLTTKIIHMIEEEKLLDIREHIK